MGKVILEKPQFSKGWKRPNDWRLKNEINMKLH